MRGGVVVVIVIIEVIDDTIQVFAVIFCMIVVAVIYNGQSFFKTKRSYHYPLFNIAKCTFKIVADR